MKEKDWDAVDKLVKEYQHLRQALDDEVNKHRRNNVEQLEEIRQLTQENEKLKERLKADEYEIDMLKDRVQDALDRNMCNYYKTVPCLYGLYGTELEGKCINCGRDLENKSKP